MEVFRVLCGFIGAWVLVAGPVYQGAVELGELKVDRSQIRAQADSVPPPARVSPWWWLIPPVAYVLVSQAQGPWRQQVMAALTPQQRAEFVTFSNKAQGWFIVGAGAALIGVEQAVELVDALEWPSLTVIPLVAAAAAAALLFTVGRMQQSQRTLRIGEADPA